MAACEGAHNNAAMRSTSTRFCSSAICGTWLRSPASTCTTGMPSDAAARAQPNVLLVSPMTTMTRASARRSASRQAHLNPGELLVAHRRPDAEEHVRGRYAKLLV